MKIEIDVKDREGKNLEIGDEIELFDWNIHNPKSLGIVNIIWDYDEGRLSTSPCIIDNPYEFYTKALPRSRKIF